LRLLVEVPELLLAQPESTIRIVVRASTQI